VHRSGAKPGDKAVVFGAGPIGLGAVLGFKAVGVEHVIAVDILPGRLERALAVGADAVINSAEDDVRAQQLQLHGAGADAMGNPRAGTDVYLDAADVPAIIDTVLDCAQLLAALSIPAVYSQPVPVNLGRALSVELNVCMSRGYPSVMSSFTGSSHRVDRALTEPISAGFTCWSDVSCLVAAGRGSIPLPGHGHMLACSSWRNESIRGLWQPSTKVSGRMTELQEHPVAITGYDTSRVPFRVADELLIPAERYYDLGFFKTEQELWLHTWQVACHETEIPRPGDFAEYQILDQPVMLIRQPDGSVRAFYNACRHRGTALACGTGTFRGGQVVCPFHGWRWNLDGSNSYVYSRGVFRPDTVSDSEVNLRPISIGLRYGFVWINFDPDAIPFEDNFRGVENAIDPHCFEKMHITWWHQIEFAANWKIAQEAFFESYHIMQAHPELALFERDENFPALGDYDSNRELGHTWAANFRSAKDVNDPYSGARLNPHMTASPAEQYFAKINAMWQGAQSMTSAHQVRIAEELITAVPPDQFFDEFYKRVYADAAERNVPLPPRTPAMTSHWTVFPNWTGVVSLGCALMYRSRPHPTDPNRSIYDFFALEIPPDGTPVTRPQIAASNAPSWDDLWFVQQDASNIERVQTGIRARAHTVSRLAPKHEEMIVNWHQTLDQWLAKYAS
jgi:phenylpropionate dioxygenase-like ring-hydroxylating dioxygenase large terminal subunit